MSRNLKLNKAADVTSASQFSAGVTVRLEPLSMLHLGAALSVPGLIVCLMLILRDRIGKI